MIKTLHSSVALILMVTTMRHIPPKSAPSTSPRRSKNIVNNNHHHNNHHNINDHHNNHHHHTINDHHNNHELANNNNNTDNDLSSIFAVKESLQQKLKSIKDFTKVVIYADDGTVILSTFDVKQKEIFDLLTIFDDQDAAFERGLDIDGDHYETHRIYEQYAYGRKGEGGFTGTGIALTRTLRKNGRYIFTLITYVFPTISAKAVSTLGKFAHENLSHF